MAATAHDTNPTSGPFLTKSSFFCFNFLQIFTWESFVACVVLYADIGSRHTHFCSHS